FGFEDDLYLVFHLMIGGRFRWKKRGAKAAGKIDLAAFDFPAGTLVMTEASSHKRASLHAVRGAAQLKDHQRGGIEVFEVSETEFAAALTRERHTLKRAMTDPNILSGIGNA